jgi:hypothetical protein
VIREPSPVLEIGADAPPPAAVQESAPVVPNSDCHYTTKDVNDLVDRMHADRTKMFQGVDILLTTEYPRSILNCTVAKPPEELLRIPQAILGSKAISRIASRLRPRYHFASDPTPMFARNKAEPTFFEREPYENDALGSLPGEKQAGVGKKTFGVIGVDESAVLSSVLHVTRFLGIAAVNNPQKAKVSFHALVCALKSFFFFVFILCHCSNRSLKLSSQIT